ncbi:MAG TPA: glycosyltransferase family 9 protein, partial [Chloroflexota bacterium]
LTGGPGEGGVAQEIAAHMETPAASVAGLASLGVLAGLIDMMDLLIGNDTGPVHLAEAVGTPTVRIFGPTDMARWAPLDEMRHVAVRHPGQDGPCSHVNAPETHQCWLWPDPEMVLEPAGALLESSAVAGRVS